MNIVIVWLLTGIWHGAAWQFIVWGVLYGVIISLEKLVELMSINPNKRFDIDCDLKAGRIADMTVFDLEKEYTVDREKLLSKGRSTPFEGEKVYGECLMTIADGIIVWEVK